MKKLWIEDDEALPSVYWQQDNPAYGNSTFTDKTGDAVAWHEYGLKVLGYYRVVIKINSIITPKANYWNGWGTLTDPEKKIACIYMLAPISMRVPYFFTEEEDSENAKELLLESINSRGELVEDIREHIYVNYVRNGKIPLTNSKQFASDVFYKLESFKGFADTEFRKWLYNEWPTYWYKGISTTYYFGIYKNAIISELRDIYNGN